MGSDTVTGAWEALVARLRAGGGDRRALVDEIAAGITDPDAAHLLNKVRNLTGSPHFEQALDEFAAAVGHVPTGGDEQAGELADATRDELYELAKRAEVPGRSSMNKDELVEALREQRG